jgi:ribonuclease R
LLTHRVIKALLKGERYQPSLHGFVAAPGATKQEYEHDLWERLGLMLSGTERRADDASRDVEAWLKCWFVKERVGETFSGRVTGVASFGIFVTLDTLHVEGMVHVSELGTEYFQFNESLHELRGERTGMRYRLTDAVQVQVARVDLEARRIEFRLVTGTSFVALRKAAARPDDSVARRVKKAAPTKPAELQGKVASVRRAEAKKAGKQETARPSKKLLRASKSAGVKKSARKGR